MKNEKLVLFLIMLALLFVFSYLVGWVAGLCLWFFVWVNNRLIKVVNTEKKGRG